MNAIERAVNGVMGWVNERTPGMMPFYKKHMSEYYAPKNFNFWYYFGSLAMVVLANQIVTGIFLTMHYKPDASLTAAGIPRAFESVEYIMRDVAGGNLIRYMHSTGASLFFVVVYLHMFRGLIYGSYQKPRELVWVIGMLIFLTLMAEAFMGYVLPWGQMSYWGAQVIINLFGAIPVIGGNSLSISYLGTFIVFVYVWLPFMILPIQAALERVPGNLIEASGDLGADSRQTFRHVLFPLALPGIVAGSIFTFSLTMGDYIIPQIVGTSRLFIGQAVYAQQGTAGNIPLAAAFSVVPIVIMGIYLTIAKRMGAFDAL